MMRKKAFTIGSITAILAVVATFSALHGKAISYFDMRVSRITDERIEHDQRFDCIRKIQKDIEEIKLMIAIMNQNNPEYEKALKILKKEN